MLARVVLLCCCVAGTLGDTPANCLYEDIQGTWTFLETERLGNNTINCDVLGPVLHTKTITLTFPNTATDELGNAGTWTMIYNQGFEVNINERSYFAFSYYYGDWLSSTSYCDRTFNGWSRDKTVRNWSCFSTQKNTKVTPRESRKSKASLLKLRKKYKNDLKMIEMINSVQSSWTAKLYPEHEKYSQYEMTQRMGSSRAVPPAPPSPPTATPEQRARVALLPENFDWRSVSGVNYVAPVRDQGGCGSCYTFASTAQVEARVRIATHNQRQDIFSPQDVVSCSVLSQGCLGGFNYLIAGRYAQDQGLVAEECNTYTGKDDTCQTDMGCPRTYVSDYSYIGGYYGGCNEELMLEALVENGPLSVSYMVYDDFFNYGGGIYHHTGLKNEFNPFQVVNHAVLLVGYGVDANTGEKFWTVKNSWGAAWGEEGYFRIRRSTNECAIESAAFDITVIP